MQKGYSIIFLLVTLTIKSLSTFSQTLHNGIVINSSNMNPVEYASITIANRSINKDADSAGRFMINIYDTDTIIISCVGYNERRLSGIELKKSVVIELVPKIKSLPTVYTGKFKTLQLGINESEISKSMSANLNEGTEFACLIEVPTDVGVYTISKVFFRIRNKPKDSKICNPVRIHVYSVNKNGNPGIELLKEDIVITEINISKKILEVDLADQDITVVEPSFFISIQWLSIDQAIDYKQPQVSFTEKGTKQLTWFKGKQFQYQWFHPETVKFWGNMMATTEIIIRESNNTKK